MNLPTAIEVKDTLWGLLNEASDLTEFYALAQRVLDTLRLTAGLWVELNYAYKCNELAREVAKRCDAYLGDRLHHKQVEKLQVLRREALGIADYFYACQEEQFSQQAAA